MQQLHTHTHLVPWGLPHALLHGGPQAKALAASARCHAAHLPPQRLPHALLDGGAEGIHTHGLHQPHQASLLPVVPRAMVPAQGGAVVCAADCVMQASGQLYG